VLGAAVATGVGVAGAVVDGGAAGGVEDELEPRLSVL
jgi:hypothetical protein